MRRLAHEMRMARHAAGLSQRALADEAGWSQSELHRFERAGFQGASLPRLGMLASVLGFDLSVSIHPLGDGLRDSAQQGLLTRFGGMLHGTFHRAREVPFPHVGDRRSWDMLLRIHERRIGIEAETRVRDVQELVRRIRQRERDGGADEVVILLSDTTHNRRVIGQLRESLGPRYGTAPRILLSALRGGRPPGSGVILL